MMGETRRLVCVAMVGIWCLLLDPSEATGHLEIKFKSYESTCKDNFFFATDCDTVFEICIDEPGPVNFQSCSYDHQTSSVHENQNEITFYGEIGRGISNPRIIQFNNFRDPRVMLAVKIIDDEFLSDEHLATLSQTIRFQPASGKNQAMWFNGRMYTRDGDGYTYTLNFQYRAYCDAYYYTSECDVYCRATDNALGHYSCHPETGQKRCYQGWEGDNCNIDINECSQGPCYNNAQCINTDGSYECQCPDGYAGKNCDLIISQCASAPCQHGGTCSGTKWSYSCACPSEWTGKNCHILTDFCQSNPCQNNGVCHGTPGGYICSCSTGWTGKNCTTEINACDDLPCQHGGTCNKKPQGEYECTCSEEYEGEHCELLKNPCGSQPCLNSGTCQRVSHDSYTCFCVHGWEGTRCENQTSFCNSNPCKNGATCTDTDDSFLCHCTPGWRGDHCTMKINPCDSRPCQNGGICRQTSGLQFECSCHVEYEGKTCEEPKDPCRSNPCYHGTCKKRSHSLFQCDCTTGWGGRLCDTGILNKIPNRQKGEDPSKVPHLPVIVGCISLLILVIIIAILLVIRRRRRQQKALSTTESGLPPVGSVDAHVNYNTSRDVAEAFPGSCHNFLHKQANLSNAFLEHSKEPRPRPPMPLPPKASSSGVVLGCGEGFYPVKPGRGEVGEEEEAGAVGGRKEVSGLEKRGGGVAWMKKKKEGRGKGKRDTNRSARPAENDYADFAELQRHATATRRNVDEDGPYNLQGVEDLAEEDHYQKLNDVCLD